MPRRLQKRPKRRIVAAPFIPNRGNELAYARDLAALARPMLKRVYAETVKAYRESSSAVALKHIGMDSAVDDLLLMLDDFRDYYNGEFEFMALALAENMVTEQFNSVNREFPRIMGNAMKAALPQQTAETAPEIPSPVSPSVETVQSALSSQETIFGLSPQMSAAIKASIAENVSLIKSIPEQFLDRVAGAVTRSMQAGGSVKQLAEEIKKYAKMTDRRAKNIALDQVRKTHCALNLRRMQEAGVTKFRWMHTGGTEKPRPFHLHDYPEGLNGGIFDIDDPPVIEESTGITGFPGQLPFCRCVMQAVIELD